MITIDYLYSVYKFLKLYLKNFSLSSFFGALLAPPAIWLISSVNSLFSGDGILYTGVLNTLVSGIFSAGLVSYVALPFYILLAVPYLCFLEMKKIKNRLFFIFGLSVLASVYLLFDKSLFAFMGLPWVASMTASSEEVKGYDAMFFLVSFLWATTLSFVKMPRQPLEPNIEVEKRETYTPFTKSILEFYVVLKMYMKNLSLLLCIGVIASPLTIFLTALISSWYAGVEFFPSPNQPQDARPEQVMLTWMIILSSSFVGPIFALPYLLLFATPYLCILQMKNIESRLLLGGGLLCLAFVYVYVNKYLFAHMGATSLLFLKAGSASWSRVDITFILVAFVSVLILIALKSIKQKLNKFE